MPCNGKNISRRPGIVIGFLGNATLTKLNRIETLPFVNVAVTATPPAPVA